MKISEIGRKINAEIKGNPDRKIDGIKDISFVKGEPVLDPKYLYYIEQKTVLKKFGKILSQAVILTSDEFKEHIQDGLFVNKEELKLAFIRLLQIYEYKPEFDHNEKLIHSKSIIANSARVYPGAVIMEGASVGENSVIYPNVVIEPFAKVGKNVIMYPNSVLGHHCVLGDNSILHACAVIGADGFGFYDHKGTRYKIPQIGNVVIKESVEIGANSSVDRATIESTIIGEFTKIDDQVHIGHNCHVGKKVYIAGNAGISGSVEIGDEAIIAGQAGIADHVKIAEKSIIMALTGVPSDTEPGQAYFGIPCRPVRTMHKINSSLGKLPELLKRVKDLEEKI